MFQNGHQKSQRGISWKKLSTQDMAQLLGGGGPEGDIPPDKP